MFYLHHATFNEKSLVPAHIILRHEVDLKSNRKFNASSLNLSCRLAWGSAQEATALLVALNYLEGIGAQSVSAGNQYVSVGPTTGERQRARRGRLKEVGMLTFDRLQLPNELLGIRQALHEPVTLAAMAAAEAIAAKAREVTSWVANGTLPLLGASPDGMIEYDDGTVEVLEVKCSSPFAPYKPSSGKKASF